MTYLIKTDKNKLNKLKYAIFNSDLDNLFSTEKPKGELAFKDTSLSIAERIIEYLQYSGGAGFHRLCDELNVSPDEIEPVIDDLVKYAEIVEQKKDTIRIYRVM